MVIPVEKLIFIKTAQNLINNFLDSKTKKKKNIVIDQGINFWKPNTSSIFFFVCKIVIITRDPRSIFASMKSRKSLSYPGNNVHTFIKWYKLIMANFKNLKNNKKIIFIKYENFILNYEKETKRLLRFLKLKKLKNKKFDINNSKKNIFKAKKILNKKELNLIEKKLKNYLQWPKKIYI